MNPLPDAVNRSDRVAVERLLAERAFTQADLDLALARAVLRFDERVELARTLIAHGANPNGAYGGDYGPIVFVTGECLDPNGLQFLLDHGADVSFAPIDTKYGRACPMTHTLGTYLRGRNPQKHRCIDLLVAHGAIVPPEVTPAMLAIHRGDVAALATHLDADPSLASRTFPTMPYGNIELRGGTLLHLAIEFDEIACIDLLLDRGADVNARADLLDGVGGQTPIFHCVATMLHAGVDTLAHLVARAGPRIDVSVRATFKRFDEILVPAMTVLDYATRSREPRKPDHSRATDREIALLASLAG